MAPRLPIGKPAAVPIPDCLFAKGRLHPASGVVRKAGLWSVLDRYERVRVESTIFHSHREACSTVEPGPEAPRFAVATESRIYVEGAGAWPHRRRPGCLRRYT